VWLTLCLIWGTTWLVIKIGLEDLPPIGFAAVRFILASAIFYTIIRVQRIPLPASRADWQFLAITGVLQFSINYSLIFWAEQYINSGLAAVLQAMIPVFGLLLAWLFLPSERITQVKILAVLLGVTGVAVIFREQLAIQNTLAFGGSIAVVISAFTAAFAAVLVKSKGRSIHPVVLAFGQMICGLPPIIAYSLIVEGNPFAFHWTGKAVASVLYLTLVGTVAAFWLYYWLLSRVESTNAMMIAVVTPLIAVLVGWIVLDELLPTQTFVGGLLIIASIALTAFKRAAPQAIDKTDRSA